ncbi:hypothetical protein IF1G_09398 [Cordyceps javanica]|uniref:Uncharacterized protein n=1 Tax=Cordyceps javanica TaxID=43265 RepID=A0A545VPY0_9HYPO|nr:hypothetical protein IF1G_09398 [Cordyceps javanica]TQW03763.1 hypothetical protein IF2G_08592 [Cordyceps javanica]
MPTRRSRHTSFLLPSIPEAAPAAKAESGRTLPDAMPVDEDARSEMLAAKVLGEVEAHPGPSLTELLV